MIFVLNFLEILTPIFAPIMLARRAAGITEYTIAPAHIFPRNANTA